MKTQDAYVDASVLLAVLFREPNALTDLGDYNRLYSSKIIEAEALRTCHRMRQIEKYSDEQFSKLLADLQILFHDLDMVSVIDSIVEEAGSAFPTIIGTLDAIHLATALGLKKRNKIDPVLLTHDRQLQVAAQAVGLAVHG